MKPKSLTDMKRAMIFIAFFVLGISLDSQAFCARDTIIIDGYVIEIERNVIYDTVFTAVEDSVILPIEKVQKKKSFKWKPSYGLEFNPGVRIGGLHSDEGALSTVGEFVAKKSPIGNSIGLGAWISHPLAQNWHCRAGAAVNFNRFSFSNFKETALDDSLWRFWSPEAGVLKQITRYDYGVLGAEVDTLDLPLIRSAVRETIIQIPLALVKEWHPKKTANFWEAHVGANFRFRQTIAGRPIALINGDGNYKFLPDSQLDIRRFDMALATGFKRFLFVRHRRWFSGGIDLSFPIGYDFVQNSNIKSNHFFFSLSFGMKFF